MIIEIKKIKRNLENKIICDKHNILASSVCIEKNCEKIINCIKCLTIDKHSHLKNVSIFNILEENIENQIHQEEFIFDTKNVLKQIKNEIENLKCFFEKEIKSFEENLVNRILNQSLENQIIKNKELFKKFKKNFLQKNDDIELIKKLANQFFFLFNLDDEKEIQISSKLIEKNKINFNNLKKNIKNLFLNLNLNQNLKNYNENSGIKKNDTIKLFDSNKKNQINLKKNKDFNNKRIKLLNNSKKIEIDLTLNQISKNYKLFYDSKIIKDNDIEFFYDKLFEKKLLKSHLLYRGTENNFLASEFHNICDNKGCTITIIKSEFNKIFGGYLSNSWNSDNFYKYCVDSFIFNLNNKEKFLQKKNNKNTFLGSTNSLTIFGYSKLKGDIFSPVSNDIKIVNQCNKNLNYSNFGSSYNLPDKMIFKSQSSKNYLAGKSVFLVKEIEIYSLFLN